MQSNPVFQGIRPTAAQYSRAAELALEHFPLVSGNDALVTAPLWKLAELLAATLAEGAADIADQGPEIAISHLFREKQTTVVFRGISTDDIAKLCAFAQNLVASEKEGA